MAFAGRVIPLTTNCASRRILVPFWDSARPSARYASFGGSGPVVTTGLNTNVSAVGSGAGSGSDPSNPAYPPHSPFSHGFTRAILAEEFSNLQPADKFVPPPAKWGGRHTVTLLPGDGIGSEMAQHVKEIFRYAAAPVDFEEIDLDATSPDVEGFEYALMSIKRNGVALKGNIETRSSFQGFQSRNVVLRNRLDLFASVLWVKNLPGIRAKQKDVDLVVIRENLEAEYSGIEHEGVPGIVESLKIITRENSMRIAHFAFEWARKYGRKKVTAIHKANIMKMSDGLFLECCRQTAQGYPDIQFDQMIIDNCSMQMVNKPGQFDVMVMPNLYGDVLSNIACGVIGGPGLVSGMNLGSRYSVFETGARNTGKSIVGQNIANPCAFIRASIDMLNFLKLEHQARVIEDAVMKTLLEDKVWTPDLGGQATTTDVVQNIVKYVKANA
ncbi:isocitrate dehydrogenase [NAD] subunit gamma, mitochondrial-like isoform X1 [Paramacrobiotus metropolitanus]|uniref:isocitrate dehydrogenase [NAD] subunit gamma, mitochondrial-like isoform X1 n=1 Tax=Paramacrobiotus metropolitanus TaxID=2943436 RepID=UPI0024463C5F|nr:isocitrate dehydrogenase [NAD] subunit gamma, mitochondrial-like isoform X1 [Paramacrobiotus metropolitanus]